MDYRYLLALLLGIGSIVSCAGSESDEDSTTATTTPTPEATPAVAVEIAASSDIMDQVPKADPTAVDPALTSTSLRVFDASLEGAFTLIMDQKITAVSGTQGTGFLVEQCEEEDSSSIYEGSFQLTYDSTATVPTFYRTTYERDSNPEFSGYTDLDIVHSVTNRSRSSDDYAYSADYVQDDNLRILLSANSETMTLKGKSSHGSVAAKWNGSIGCAKMEGGTAFPFTISAGTDGEKTYETGTDESYCDDLTEFATVKANATLESPWDCSIPTGTTRNDLSITAPELEDLGGTRCEDASGFWHESSTSTDESSCGDGTTLAEVMCFVDAFYARFAKAEGSAFRSMECKLAGVEGAADQGTIDSIGLDDLEADEFVIISEGRSE